MLALKDVFGIRHDSGMLRRVRYARCTVRDNFDPHKPGGSVGKTFRRFRAARIFQDRAFLASLANASLVTFGRYGLSFLAASLSPGGESGAGNAQASSSFRYRHAPSLFPLFPRTRFDTLHSHSRRMSDGRHPAASSLLHPQYSTGLAARRRADQCRFQAFALMQSALIP
jgi:hypothetical protein